ncbi:hypothetical protein BGZ98_005530, partial [Dissophora globulifera]
PYGMDIILPAGASGSGSGSSSQRPILPPPISTVPPRRSGQPMEEYDDSRRAHRHERTMSESHLSGYMSPTSISPISPPPERHMDTQYRDEHDDDSPSPVAQSPFANGASSSSVNGGNSNRHSASLASFGLKAMSKDRSEEAEPMPMPRERPTSAYYNNPAQAAKNRRSFDEALYDEHQQLMRDNFNMDTRLVISEEEPRPESAIDLLAYAAAYVQESEEHKKEEDKDNIDEKRDGLGHLGSSGISSNKRQSFHGPTGYPSKEPFQDDLSSASSRFSSAATSASGMAWEASPPAGGSSNANSNGSNIEVMPVPRRRGGDDGPYAPRRPRPVTYGGSGFLYDHQENQFMPQSPSTLSLSSSSFLAGAYSRPSSSASSRRMSHRNSTEMGSGLLLQRGLTRPRRSSSTATAGMMSSSHAQHASMPGVVLPPIIN